MTTYTYFSGGGGGRIIPGTGGAGGISFNETSVGGDGGSGGAAGESTIDTGAGGGGWGASGGFVEDPLYDRENPGAGGKAVNLNGYSLTWSGTFSTDFSNRVFGSVS